MNIEEKAKRYADWVIHAIGRRCTISHDRIANDFTAGYTQAVTDLSAENEKLREALRELIDKVNMLTYSIVEEDIQVNSEFFAETMDALAKAKQLITDEK